MIKSFAREAIVVGSFVGLPPPFIAAGDRIKRAVDYICLAILGRRYGAQQTGDLVVTNEVL
jgi:hypothetical protein